MSGDGQFTGPDYVDFDGIEAYTEEASFDGATSVSLEVGDVLAWVRRSRELEAENERLSRVDLEPSRQMLVDDAESEAAFQSERASALQRRLEQLLRLIESEATFAAARGDYVERGRWLAVRDAALGVSPVPSQPAPETQPTNEAKYDDRGRRREPLDPDAADRLMAERLNPARQQDEPARAEEEQA